MLGQPKNESARLKKFEEDLIEKERNIQVGLSIEMETGLRSLCKEIKDRLERKNMDKKEAATIAGTAFEASKDLERISQSLLDFPELKDFQTSGPFLEKRVGEERTIIYIPSGEMYLQEVMEQIDKMKLMRKFHYYTNSDGLQIANLNSFIKDRCEKVKATFSKILKQEAVPVSKIKKDGDTQRQTYEKLG